VRVTPGGRLPVIGALTYRNTFMIVLQEPDAFNKVQFSDYHHQIYGIKILLTTEASGQICFRFYSGVKLFA
jgi:hypothetical protein